MKHYLTYTVSKLRLYLLAGFGSILLLFIVLTLSSPIHAHAQNNNCGPGTHYNAATGNCDPDTPPPPQLGVPSGTTTSPSDTTNTDWWSSLSPGTQTVIEIGGILVGLWIITRIFRSRGIVGATTEAAVGGGGITTELGTITAQEVENLVASSGGRTVQLFTKLTQSPTVGRAISLTTDRALAETARAEGQIYVFRVPQLLFKRMQLIQAISTPTTSMGGVVASEYRVFLPDAVNIILRFLAP